MRATSACLVLPEATCRYEGFVISPPAYPATADLTPLTSSKTASTHQKHPAPNVACSRLVEAISVVVLEGSCACEVPAPIVKISMAVASNGTYFIMSCLVLNNQVKSRKSIDDFYPPFLTWLIIIYVQTVTVDLPFAEDYNARTYSRWA